MKNRKTKMKLSGPIVWPFEINIDLAPEEKSRVAFMSSQSRTFFPEDPGVSRFGIYYSMNCAPGEVPNPKYYPSTNRLEKPVSTKGYGMGGLSGPRFAKLHLEGNPAPNAYQREMSLVVPSKKTTKSSHGKLQSKSKELEVYELLPPAQRKTAIRQLCLQGIVGFGSHLSVDRFGVEPSFKNVGVGYYDLQRPQAKLAKESSFGLSPVKLLYPVQIRCNYQGYDRCLVCDDELRTIDYYRSKTKLPYPPQETEGVEADVATKNVTVTINEPPVVKTQAAKTVLGTLEKAPKKKIKVVFINLCRKCYCKGKRGELPFWTRNEMSWLFRKARHCCFIHEHHDIPEFTHKTSCNFIRKVQKKEALMAKYYKDECERMLKQKR